MYQKIIIVGNLGGDPEMRYTENAHAVTNFSMAVNRRRTDRHTGESQDETTWFRVSVWGRQAEAVNQYMTKGRQVMVEGRLRPDPDTGGPRIFARQDGSAGAAFEVVADRVVFMGSGDDDGEQSAATATQKNISDDIQF